MVVQRTCQCDICPLRERRRRFMSGLLNFISSRSFVSGKYFICRLVFFDHLNRRFLPELLCSSVISHIRHILRIPGMHFAVAVTAQPYACWLRYTSLFGDFYGNNMMSFYSPKVTSMSAKLAGFLCHSIFPMISSTISSGDLFLLNQ